MNIIFLYFASLLILFNVETISEKCKESTCTKDAQSSVILKYMNEKKEKWSSILRTIENAVNTYIPCTAKNCSCYLDLISKDLGPFHKGINKHDIEDAAKMGTMYQVFDHRLYRVGECMFPNRCKGVEYFLLKIVHKLPDIEFVLNTKDWPMIASYAAKILPVFSFSKTKDYLDITYPAWSFWEGGPAIRLYPGGIGRWDLLRKSLMKEANIWPWEKKRNIGFFRGSRTSSQRDNLIYLSRNEPILVDAHYTKNQAWKSDADTLNAAPAEEVSFEEHCRYKYLFNYRGVAASFRLKHLFLCGSVVFHVGDEWTEFFYPQLVPWVHYIPVSDTASQDDLRDLLYFSRENDKVVQEIATRGYKFIESHLRMKDVLCYWGNLLNSYSELLSYKPKLRNVSHEIKL